MLELVTTARNPAPYGGEVGAVPGQGPVLRYAVWPALGSGQAGTICIFSGRTEFIEKYLEVVADLRRRGFAVALLDWRGQGGSERALEDSRKNHVASFREYQADAMRFMREVVQQRCPQPYTALGHSMGGNVLIHLATRLDCPFKSLVLSAPMIGLHPKRLQVSEPVAYAWAAAANLAGFGDRYVPRGGPESLESLPFEDNPLTSDPERFARMQEVARVAPHLVVGDPTIGWLRAALQAMRQLKADRHQIKVRIPVLAFTAGQDRIVASRATEDYCDLLKVGRCIELPDAQHEILQERDSIRSQFWAAFDGYMDVGEWAA